MYFCAEVNAKKAKRQPKKNKCYKILMEFILISIIIPGIIAGIFAPYLVKFSTNLYHILRKKIKKDR